MLDQKLRLSSKVALRPEPFGALAYHFGNRKLTFLKRPELVEVVRRLDGAQSLRSILTECSIPQDLWSVYTDSLTRLMDSEMIDQIEEDSRP
jgi:putative mycofactocin binding protein MftB